MTADEIRSWLANDDEYKWWYSSPIAGDVILGQVREIRGTPRAYTVPLTSPVSTFFFCLNRCTSTVRSKKIRPRNRRWQWSDSENDARVASTGLNPPLVNTTRRCRYSWQTFDQWNSRPVPFISPLLVSPSSYLCAAFTFDECVPYRQIDSETLPACRSKGSGRDFETRVNWTKAARLGYPSSRHRPKKCCIMYISLHFFKKINDNKA